MNTDADREIAMDKQKRMLEATDPGHFSMVRALHLADLITLLNGMAQSSQLESVHCANVNLRLLRYQLAHVLPPLLHG
jgi:hypothetical protein